MVFGLFQRLDRTQCHAVVVGLQHDLLASFLFELEDAQEDPYHVLHRVMVVIMQQDLIERDMHPLPVGNRNRPGSCQGRCRHDSDKKGGCFHLWIAPGFKIQDSRLKRLNIPC